MDCFPWTGGGGGGGGRGGAVEQRLTLSYATKVEKVIEKQHDIGRDL